MIKLKINGQDQNWDGDPDLSLLWYLRDEAGLTGTKFGCGMALCGACTVNVEGQPTRSCVTPVSAVVGKRISTIEAVGEDAVGKVVQQAWRQLDVVQCGYCQSGQIMAATALLSSNKAPSDADIDAATVGKVAVDLKGHDGAEPGEFLSAATACDDCHHGGIPVECGNQYFERFGIFMRLGGADGIGS